MPLYHFSLGNSSSGPIGFCAEVTAETPERAVEILRTALNGYEIEVPVETEQQVFVDTAAGEAWNEVEYIQVYFGGPASITTKDIDFTEKS